MSENARHCADPTCHHEKHGYGGCGGRGQTRVVRAVSYEEYQDGCWKVEVKAPGAGWLKGDDGWRARTWWLADAKDRPHICFVGDDFTIAAKVKALAFEVFGKIPGSVPSVAQDEIAALRVPPASAPGGEVGEYRRQAAERAVQDEGAMWSLLRSILSQGKDIHLDYAEKRYEEYSARLDVAARERASDLFAAVRRAAEQGYQDGVNKWMPIAERAAKQEREGFVKALLAIGIEPTEDDDGRWYVAAEPDGQDFDTLKEALIFAFNLRDADREQRAAEQGRREALAWAYEQAYPRGDFGITRADWDLGRTQYVVRGLAALADDEGRGR